MSSAKKYFDELDAALSSTGLGDDDKLKIVANLPTRFDNPAHCQAASQRLWNAATDLSRTSAAPDIVECEIRETSLKIRSQDTLSTQRCTDDFLHMCATAARRWLQMGQLNRATSCLDIHTRAMQGRGSQRTHDLPAYLEILLCRAQIIFAKCAADDSHESELRHAIEQCISWSTTYNAPGRSERVAESLFEDFAVISISKECHRDAIWFLQSSASLQEAAALRDSSASSVDNRQFLAKTFNTLALCLYKTDDFVACEGACRKALACESPSFASTFLLLQCSLRQQHADDVTVHLKTILDATNVKMSFALQALKECNAHNFNIDAAVTNLLSNPTLSPEKKLKIRVFCLQSLISQNNIPQN